LSSVIVAGVNLVRLVLAFISGISLEGYCVGLVFVSFSGWGGRIGCLFGRVLTSIGGSAFEFGRVGDILAGRGVKSFSFDSCGYVAFTVLCFCFQPGRIGLVLLAPGDGSFGTWHFGRIVNVVAGLDGLRIVVALQGRFLRALLSLRTNVVRFIVVMVGSLSFERHALLWAFVLLIYISWFIPQVQMLQTHFLSNLRDRSRYSGLLKVFLRGVCIE
jgi:hypothetical protein